MQKYTEGRLVNQVALITDGVNRSGEATARLFASEDAALVVVDINSVRG